MEGEWQIRDNPLAAQAAEPPGPGAPTSSKARVSFDLPEEPSPPRSPQARTGSAYEGDPGFVQSRSLASSAHSSAHSSRPSHNLSLHFSDIDVQLPHTDTLYNVRIDTANQENGAFPEGCSGSSEWLDAQTQNMDAAYRSRMEDVVVAVGPDMDLSSRLVEQRIQCLLEALRRLPTPQAAFPDGLRLVATLSAPPPQAQQSGLLLAWSWHAEASLLCLCAASAVHLEEGLVAVMLAGRASGRVVLQGGHLAGAVRAALLLGEATPPALGVQGPSGDAAACLTAAAQDTAITAAAWAAFVDWLLSKKQLCPKLCKLAAADVTLAGAASQGEDGALLGAWSAIFGVEFEQMVAQWQAAMKKVSQHMHIDKFISNNIADSSTKASLTITQVWSWIGTFLYREKFEPTCKVLLGILYQCMMIYLHPELWARILKESGQQRPDVGVLVPLIAVLFVLELLQAYAQYFLVKHLPSGNGFNVGMRLKMTRHIVGLPQLFTDNANLSTMRGVLHNDIPILGDAIQAVFVCLMDNVKVVITLAVLYKFSRYLAIWSTFMIPITLGFSYFRGGKVSSSAVAFRNEEKVYLSRTEEVLALSSVWRACGAADEVATRLGEHAVVVRQQARALKLSTARSAAQSQIIDVCGDVFTIGLGAILISTGNLTLANFVPYYIAAAKLSSYVYSVGRTLIKFHETRGSLSLILNIFEMKAEKFVSTIPTPDPRNPTLLKSAAAGGLKIVSDYEEADRPMLYGTLVLKDVGFKHSRDNMKLAGLGSSPYTISGVSFAIPRGMRVGIVGKSGSGKSTLVNLLTRRWQATTGSIELDGIPLNELNISALVAKVPQEVQLFEGTIRDNLLLGAAQDTTDVHVQEALKFAALASDIEELEHGLETQVGIGGTQLSLGQRQRVAIARARLQDTPVCVLDEPTSGQHPGAAAHIANGLSTMARRNAEPVTVLAVSHQFSLFRDFDRIAVVHNKTVAEYGSHKHLNEKKGIFYQMNLSQEGLEGDGGSGAACSTKRLKRLWPLARVHSEAFLADLAHLIVKRHLNDGDRLVSEGQDMEFLVIVAQGRLVADGETDLEWTVGESLMEASIVVEDKPVGAPYSITAAGPADVLLLARQHFHLLLRTSPEQARPVMELVEAHRQVVDAGSLQRNVWPLGLVEREALEQEIVPSLETVVMPAGTVLFDHASGGCSALYVLLQGRVRLVPAAAACPDAPYAHSCGPFLPWGTPPPPTQERMVHVPGSVFGEETVFTRLPSRYANATVVGDETVMVVLREEKARRMLRGSGTVACGVRRAVEAHTRALAPARLLSHWPFCLLPPAAAAAAAHHAHVETFVEGDILTGKRVDGLEEAGKVPRRVLVAGRVVETRRTGKAQWNVEVEQEGAVVGEMEGSVGVSAEGAGGVGLVASLPFLLPAPATQALRDALVVWSDMCAEPPDGVQPSSLGSPCWVPARAPVAQHLQHSAADGGTRCLVLMGTVAGSGPGEVVELHGGAAAGNSGAAVLLYERRESAERAEERRRAEEEMLLQAKRRQEARAKLAQINQAIAKAEGPLNGVAAAAKRGSMMQVAEDKRAKGGLKSAARRVSMAVTLGKANSSRWSGDLEMQQAMASKHLEDLQAQTQQRLKQFAHIREELDEALDVLRASQGNPELVAELEPSCVAQQPDDPNLDLSWRACLHLEGARNRANAQVRAEGDETKTLTAELQALLGRLGEEAFEPEDLAVLRQAVWGATELLQQRQEAAAQVTASVQAVCERLGCTESGTELGITGCHWPSTDVFTFSAACAREACLQALQGHLVQPMDQAWAQVQTLRGELELEGADEVQYPEEGHLPTLAQVQAAETELERLQGIQAIVEKLVSKAQRATMGAAAFKGMVSAARAENRHRAELEAAEARAKQDLDSAQLKVEAVAQKHALAQEETEEKARIAIEAAEARSKAITEEYSEALEAAKAEGAEALESAESSRLQAAMEAASEKERGLREQLDKQREALEAEAAAAVAVAEEKARMVAEEHARAEAAVRQEALESVQQAEAQAKAKLEEAQQQAQAQLIAAKNAQRMRVLALKATEAIRVPKVAKAESVTDALERHSALVSRCNRGGSGELATRLRTDYSPGAFKLLEEEAARLDALDAGSSDHNFDIGMEAKAIRAAIQTLEEAEQDLQVLDEAAASDDAPLPLSKRKAPGLGAKFLQESRARTRVAQIPGIVRQVLDSLKDKLPAWERNMKGRPYRHNGKPLTIDSVRELFPKATAQSAASS